MTKAFAVCFIVGVLLLWIGLSIEHGKALGKELKQSIVDFFNGRN